MLRLKYLALPVLAVSISASFTVKSQAVDRYNSNEVAAVYMAAVLSGAAVASAYNNTSVSHAKMQVRTKTTVPSTTNYQQQARD